MQTLKHFEVTGLFGDASHSFDMRIGEPTILTGPNGVGKTQILGLIYTILKLDMWGLVAIPFKRAGLTFEYGRTLFVSRDFNAEGERSITLWLERDGKRLGDPVIFDNIESPRDRLPEYVHELTDGRWYDTRADRVLSSAQIERIFGISSTSLARESLQGTEIGDLVKGSSPIFIDTKRLDTPTFKGEAAGGRFIRASGGPTRGPARHAASRIDQYVEQLRLQVSEARRASVVETQSADLSFASRALAAAHDRVNESQLRTRYNRIVEQYEHLTRNGLATGEEPLRFPSNTTPTIRRILNVFLDDWERRLRPLLPINEKLTLLRRVLDEKFATTGKSTMVTPQGGIAFRDRRGRRIRVSGLSSGEQHLVALYTMLMFSAKPGSFVLVDEPEISLHAVWKHAFLEDITEVAKLANLQILIATHSSGIINGRWDLTEELQAPVLEVATEDQGEDLESESDPSSEGSEDWLA